MCKFSVIFHSLFIFFVLVTISFFTLIINPISVKAETLVDLLNEVTNPEPSPEPTPTSEPSPEPTQSPVPTPETSPQPSPTAEPTPSPTATPEPTATPQPTTSPQPSPDTSPTPAPTPSASPVVINPSPTPATGLGGSNSSSGNNPPTTINPQNTSPQLVYPSINARTSPTVLGAQNKLATNNQELPAQITLPPDLLAWNDTTAYNYERPVPGSVNIALSAVAANTLLFAGVLTKQESISRAFGFIAGLLK